MIEISYRGFFLCCAVEKCIDKGAIGYAINICTL